MNVCYHPIQQSFRRMAAITTRSCPLRKRYQQYNYTTTASVLSDNNKTISDILQNVKDGTIEPLEAEKLITLSQQQSQQQQQATLSSSSRESSSDSSSSSSEADNILSSFANLDYNRTSRTGFPEVVFGSGKTPQQIATILDDFARHLN